MKYGTRINTGYIFIKHAMDYCGYDNEYMAEQLGIKKETFIKYINCKSKLPNKHRQKLMDIFKDVMMQHGWTEDIFFHYNKEITK